MISRHSLLIVLVAVVLIFSIGVAGQPSTSPQTDTNGSTFTSNTGDGGGGGGLLPSFDPVKNAERLLQELLGLPGWIFEGINEMVFGIPAPGEPDKPNTWISPTNGLWPGLAEYTKWTTGIAVFFLTVSGSLTFYHSKPHEQRQAWKRWLLALIMILTTWTLLPLTLHMANELSVALRPSSSEAFENFANFSKISAGLVTLLIVVIAQFSVAAIGMFVLVLERFLIYLGFGLWPIAWALRSTRFDLARSLGETLVFIFGVTIATKIGQALIARLLFSLNWAGVSPNSALYVLAVAAGTFFMLIYFPWKMLEHANHAASVSLGMSTGHRGARRYGRSAHYRASERIGDVRDKYQNWRNSSDNSDSGALDSGNGSASSSSNSNSSGGSSQDTTQGEYTNWQDEAGTRRDKTIWGSKTQRKRHRARRRRKRHKEQVKDLNNDDSSF